MNQMQGKLCVSPPSLFRPTCAAAGYLYPTLGGEVRRGEEVVDLEGEQVRDRVESTGGKESSSMPKNIMRLLRLESKSDDRRRRCLTH